MSKNGKNGSGLSQRLISLVFLLVLVAGIAGYIPVRNIETDVSTQYSNHAQEVAKLLGAELDRSSRAVQTLSLDERLHDRSAWYRSWESNSIVQVLNDHIDVHDIYSLIMLVDTRGQLIAVNDRAATGETFDPAKLYLGNYRSTTWFRALERENYLHSSNTETTGDPADVPVMIEDLHLDEMIELCDLGSDGRTMSFSVPLYEEGKVIAFLNQRVRFAAVEDFCGFLRQSSDHLVGDLGVMVLDGSGRLLVDFDSAGTRTRKDQARDYGSITTNLDSAGSRAVRNALNGESGFTWRFTETGGERKVAAYTHLPIRASIPGPDWTVLVSASHERILAATGITRTRRTMAGIFGLLVILIICVTMLVKRDRTRMSLRRARRQVILDQARSQTTAPHGLEMLGVQAGPSRVSPSSIPDNAHSQSSLPGAVGKNDQVDEWHPTLPVRETPQPQAAPVIDPKPVAKTAPVAPEPVAAVPDGTDNTRIIKRQLEELSKSLLAQDTISDSIRIAEVRERKLKAVADEAIERVELAERENQVATTASAAAQRKLDDARTEWQKIQLSLAEAIDGRETDTTRLERIHGEVEDIRRETARTLQESDDLREDLRSTRQECISLRVQAEELLIEATTLCDQVSELRNGVAALRHEKEQAGLEVAAARTEAEFTRQMSMEARIRAAQTHQEHRAMAAMASVSHGAPVVAEPSVTAQEQVQPQMVKGTEPEPEQATVAGFKSFNAKPNGIRQRSVMTYALEDLARDLSEATGDEVHVSEYDVEAMRVQVSETKMKSIPRQPEALGASNSLHGGGVRPMPERPRRTLPSAKGAGA
ncbi:MAG: hypothetical protein GY835_04240 [bacterium]|nr:hypothetical protein [bacterium]